MTDQTPASAMVLSVADALVTVERAEHGLPPVKFGMLSGNDQATYRKRAEAALAAAPPAPAGRAEVE